MESHRRHSLRLVGLFCAITGCFLVSRAARRRVWLARQLPTGGAARPPARSPTPSSPSPLSLSPPQVYSLIQERLMTLGFGPPGAQERFRHSLFIILVNRLVAVAVAAAALGLAGKSLQPAAPLGLFGVPSAANVLGSASQYEALKYVSFPLQALAKCAKTVSGRWWRGCGAGPFSQPGRPARVEAGVTCCAPPALHACRGLRPQRRPRLHPDCFPSPSRPQVPVMAWGLLLGGRRYDSIDYVCALTVTFGCALFVLTGSIAAPQLRAAATAAGAALAAHPAAGAGSGISRLDLLAAGGLARSSVGAAGLGSADGMGAHPWLLYGLLLLGAFLLFDGLTSTTQVGRR